MSTDGYGDWAALSKAIKSAAQKAVAEGRASDVNAAISQAHFDRFLSRVFSQGEDSAWLLKGGAGMLARVSRARATKDVDLAATGELDDLDRAQDELQQLVGHDLGDHIRFTIASSRPTGLADNQPGVATRRLVFTCTDTRSGRKVGTVPVDVVVGPAPVGTAESVTPANRLELPRSVPSHPYRLFPIADQVAEKVCATVSTKYSGSRHSSRIKDMVDLVIIARTQRIDLDELRTAIATKRVLSKLEPFDHFAPPPAWSTGYRALATKSAHLIGDLTDLDVAHVLVSELVDQALTTTAGTESATWVPGHGWLDPSTAATTHTDSDEPTGHGSEPVRAHTRSGQPVRSYTRSPRTH